MTVAAVASVAIVVVVHCGIVVVGLLPSAKSILSLGSYGWLLLLL